MTDGKTDHGGKGRSNRIYVASDGTGRTAYLAVTAALAQFPGARVRIVVRPDINTTERAGAVVREAAEAGGFVVHTIVTDEVHAALIKTGRELNVETIDLMGPLIARLTETLATSPTEKPGLFSQINKTYFRRIETMEFALRHDDGQRVEDLRKAELVLLGVSRTFKTPLSIYLAFKGWFVANVPITLEHEPPAVLSRLPPVKVFGLDTNARQLAELRRTRAEAMGGALAEYADPEYVRIELMRARQFYAKHPRWAVINVTNKPIEEIATEILALRGASEAKMGEVF
jgi:regulator of PEP synthase PpsR (kinase-PPPase family)